MLPFRIGQGFDVHAFEEGDHLMLCGVRVPHDKAFKAHSDGDVALHALCDALLGAVALGDIGQHFPDTDSAYAGADSRVLLRDVVAKVGHQGYAVGNVDITIAAQAPKLSPFVDEMRATVAQDLAVEKSAVSVKATTTEKLGFTGRKEGIAAFATVMLQAL